MQSSADVVICGAGMAGVATAYHLAARQNVRRVVIVDEREPLTLTSDKGTQGYRNWWPGPDDTMFRLVSRSIDLLEESAAACGNAFRMNRRGYVFATANEERVSHLEATAKEVSGFGMGPVRTHTDLVSYRPAPPEGFVDQPIGADLLLDDAAREAFPFLAPETVAALHIRRAGYVNAVSLGAWLLERACAAGVRFVRDRVEGVRTTGGRVSEVNLASGDTIETERFVIAAGPALPNIARLLDLELPVVHELHAKVTFRDTRRTVRRDAPFLIWMDPVRIDWNDDERREFENNEHTRRFLEALPSGVHARPVDLVHGDEVYLIWTYETDQRPFEWPPTFDPYYGDVTLRGCSHMIPAMAAYVRDASPRGLVDGGFYCKTKENRPLVGPLPIEGAYVVGALSGFGVMASHACGELVSLHIAGGQLPDYAKWFLPSRYDDPEYRALVEQWGPLMGQL
jgi:glycine/D-amino acid oxidase-like deaminating enzyme